MITTIGEVKSFTVVEGLVHLAADDATVGEIEDALDEKKFKYRRDTSVEGGFRVDTDKQYKGWAMMMQREAMLTALGMGVIPAELPASRVSSSGMAAAGKNIAMDAAKGATATAKGGTSLWPAASGGRTVINGIEYTTHALQRMQPIGTAIDKAGKLASRGITPSVVENAIKHGTVSAGRTTGEVVRTFENVRVITNPQGTRVITVYKFGN